MIGWRQHYDANQFQIDAGLTNSESGIYYQDLHPMVTLENVRAVSPNFNTSAEFDTWLEEKTKASILKAIRTFWDTKMSEKTANSILENKTIFDGTGRISDLVENQSNLVGFEINVNRSKGVTTKINKVGLQFKGTGVVKLYIMHSSRPDPIKEITATRTRDGGMEWFDLTGAYLPYESADIDSGGSYYLVYDQTEVEANGMQAIKKNRDWSKSPCNSCNSSEINSYRVWSRYLEVHPFKVSKENGPVVLWDIQDNVYTYETNYGINLQLTIECDVTDIILQQKRSFQNIVGLQVAMDMMREFAYNPQFNIDRQSTNFSKQDILYEIDGDSQSYKKSGIKFEFDKALKSIMLDTTNMSRVCFPCGKKGVKYRTT